MSNKKPSVVVTDGDKAMRVAIAEVLPSAKYRLHGWHLKKNCIQRVKEPEFRKVFKKAVYANFDIEEFEEYWKTAVESLELMNNSWGINAFIKGFLKSINSILKLVHNLDWVVKYCHNNEVTTQFFSSYYTPVLTTGLDLIELFASKIYTIAVFKEVRKQINGVETLLFLGKDSISTTTVYNFSKIRNRCRVRKVLYNPSEPKIECDCQMWNNESIPCCHIFCVMKHEGLDERFDTEEVV
ncbi:protein FAR1-RELATED SEQUENCE 5-like [Arachis hypogaea]|uniref:protein FAR1-RELATED SEQUENCE 5-like n=1 Tax=Arachis hypogaea TaxID=3818 RepID=UPI000DECAD7D|nr:protein FAR1-RELATED SEQUENCE 5-like [Arachis hypogaea]